MKKVLYVALLLIIITYTGCNKDDSNPVNGAADVTIRISNNISADTVYFLFKSSDDVKIDTIITSVPAKSFVDVYTTGEPDRVFKKDVLYQWIGYYGIQRGQQCNFVFKRKTSLK